jgi:hypothetical protein
MSIGLKRFFHLFGVTILPRKVNHFKNPRRGLSQSLGRNEHNLQNLGGSIKKLANFVNLQACSSV